MKLAIIGTRGIPAQYGGFETLVEFLTKFLSEKMDITVFCSKENKWDSKTYNNSNLVFLPFNANGWQGIFYDSVSILKSYKKYDKILILGCANFVMPLMKKYKNKFILNIGGIEWQREKWGRFIPMFIKYSERICIANSNCLIADNEGIRDYLLKTYNRKSNIIEYGGDQAERVTITERYVNKHLFLTEEYILAVARIQPDNNIEMIIQSFNNIKKYKLVIIGNWNHSKYGKELRQRYQSMNTIILLDAIYDQEELNVIRSNTKLHLHGHSAGGTNPGLVEAMYLEMPIFCFDNVFNRYTTENRSMYFSTAEELHTMLMNVSDESLRTMAHNMKEIAERRYKWELIANKYYKNISEVSEVTQ
ncbi:rhamnosyltransferase [Spirochaetia bacterium]|nr:rhamnosyltransferase [Spirochaetia bacterium]